MPVIQAKLNSGDLLTYRLNYRARAHAVRILMLFYLCIVLDGALRKYILPGFSEPLHFVRDPVLIYLYIYAMRNSLITLSPFLRVGVVILAFTVIAVLVQFHEGGPPISIVMYGFRQYYSLLPLPFIMAKILRREDMRLFFRLNMFLITAMAPLMVLQVLSPLDSWINLGGATDTGGHFENLTYGDEYLGFVRASGFFTPGGVTPFLVLVAAIVLIVHMMPRRDRPCSRSFLIVATFALLVCVAVSGNRSVIVSLALIFIGGITSLFLMPGTSSTAVRALIAPLIIISAGYIVSVALFPEQLQAIGQRWAIANVNSGGGAFAIVDRAAGDFIAFTEFLPNTPLEGIGMGTASNAYLQLYSGGNFLTAAAEGDWSRHIIDLGPIVGVCYIAFRVALTLYLGILAIRVARRNADPTAWIFFCSSVFTILYGQLSAQSTIGGFGWFGIGLILAAPSYAYKPRSPPPTMI